MLKDDGWEEAIKGCDAIMHVAGPFPVGYDGGEKELTGPHEDGAMRVFKLAKEHGIKRIILTSSVASIKALNLLPLLNLELLPAAGIMHITFILCSAN